LTVKSLNEFLWCLKRNFNFFNSKILECVKINDFVEFYFLKFFFMHNFFFLRHKSILYSVYTNAKRACFICIFFTNFFFQIIKINIRFQILQPWQNCSIFRRHRQLSSTIHAIWNGISISKRLFFSVHRHFLYFLIFCLKKEDDFDWILFVCVCVCLFTLFLYYFAFLVNIYLANFHFSRQRSQFQSSNNFIWL